MINIALLSTPASTAGAVFSGVGVVILLYTVFIPGLDTRRSRRTFGLNVNFFKTYVCAGCCMGLNAVLNIIKFAQMTGKTPQIILFTAFVFLNTITIYLNSYIIKIKMQNMREAAERNMSEQDYGETVLKFQVANKD